MRPVHLHVEGLRSFRAGVDIDFDGRDHVAIIGDTGAGKSSLLQAITYALFGRTTYSGHANQELMNDTSTQLRVVLDFTVSGQRWKLVRLLRRAGDGTVGQAQATLMKLADDGETVLEQLEQVRPVNVRVEQILGLDFDAFVRTVLLPQGEFARLLVGDRPTERAAILQQIWRTDELTAAGTAAAATLNELKPVLARLDQARSVEPDDPDAHLAALRAAAETATAAATATAADLDQAETAAAALQQAGERRATAERAAEMLHRFDTDTATAAARKIAAAAETLHKRRNTRTADFADVAEQLAAVPEDSDGWTATTVAAAREQLRQLPDVAADLTARTTEWRAAERDAVDADVDASAVETQADETEEHAKRHTGDRAPLAEDATAATDRLAAARTALGRARDTAARAAAITDQLAQLTADAAAADAAITTAQHRHVELREAADEAARTGEQLRRRDAAAAAAHGLHEGDICPVCAGDLPDGWTAPDTGDLDAAVAAAKDAEQSAGAARDEMTGAKNRAETLHTRIAEAEAEATTVRIAAHDTLTELADFLYVTATQIDLDAEDTTVLATLHATADTAQKTLADHDRDAAELLAAASSVRAKATATRGRAKDKAAEAAAGRQRAEQALQRLAGLRDSLPDGLTVTVPADVEDMPDANGPLPLPGVVEATARLDERQRVLDERQQQRTALHNRRETLDQELAEIDRRMSEAVTGPAGALAKTLDTHRDDLSAARQQLAHADGDITAVDIPPVAAAVDPKQLPGHVGQVATTTAALRDVAGQVTDAAQAASTAAIVELRTLAARLADIDQSDSGPGEIGAEGDAGRIAEALTATLRARAEDASYTARTKTHDATQFADRADAVRGLHTAHATLEHTCRVVGDVAAALKPGAFPKSLALRRSRALLIYASRLLGEMTAGRYAFADLADDQSEWLVIDTDSGLPRSPQSLSGGEQFIASLALALGIVEMMARSGGRLESLWLDEGFGALDRSNLDAAVEALATVASGGRMVAVISHVAAVADQVEDVLAVTRSATGSTAEWLTAEQRNDVADADLPSDVSGALAGLLA